jgi:hypothetical protein
LNFELLLLYFLLVGVVYRAVVAPNGALWWKNKKFSSVRSWIQEILSESPHNDNISLNEMELNAVTVDDISLKELKIQCATQIQVLSQNRTYPL